MGKPKQMVKKSILQPVDNNGITQPGPETKGCRSPSTLQPSSSSFHFLLLSLQSLFLETETYEIQVTISQRPSIKRKKKTPKAMLCSIPRMEFMALGTPIYIPCHSQEPIPMFKEKAFYQNIIPGHAQLGH